MKSSPLINIFKSIYIMGIYKSFLRLKFELKRLIDSYLPEKLLLFLYKINEDCPDLKENYAKSFERNLPPFKSKLFTYIKFDLNLLNEKKKLNFPSSWNNKSWTRLWQFNLHYFEWTKDLVTESLRKQKWVNKSEYIEYLIDDWINSNKLGRGDGWHSYTISLRIRNLIWIYRFIPELQTKKRLNSLWIQLNWLNSHIEYFHFGNHILENLIALVFVSLQFKGSKAEKIYKINLNRLKKELNIQIMNDGGHIERSAVYHLLILDRLVELSYLIKLTGQKEINWLSLKIKKMEDWTKKIQLLNNRFPKFNDSALNISSDLDLVLYKSKTLKKRNLTKNDILKTLLIKKLKSYKNQNLSNINEKKNIKTIILKDTGWTIFKVNNSWEITFKWGESGYKKSPGHINADLLSIDIYFKGIPIIVGSGTSIYENSTKRSFERSSASKNSIQLADFKNARNSKSIKWIDSIETWGSFGTGRVPKTINYNFEKIHNNKVTFLSSIDGFLNLRSLYQRKIILENNDNELLIDIIDTLDCKKEILYKLNWHEGPNLNKKILKKIIKDNHDYISKKYSQNIIETWISEDFNLREKRFTLLQKGLLSKGENILTTRIYLPVKFYNEISLNKKNNSLI